MSTRNFMATHNLIAVSAGSRETAINTVQTLDVTLLAALDNTINLEPRREPNADEATGYEEPDLVYDLGHKTVGPLSFPKAQPQHFAFILAYALGLCYSSAIGSAYEHEILPIDGDLDGDRSNPSFTAAQRFGKTVLKRRFGSMFVDSFTATFPKDDWVQLAAEIKGTGLVADNLTNESVTANDNVTTLTLAANAVEGATAAERLANVQRIRAYYNSAWRDVSYSAVSAATPAVITITSVGGAGASITYEVDYIPTESGWMSFPARVTETPLRVSEMTLKVGGALIEYITNGTMETDANWSDVGTPATNERSATQVHGGSYSRKFTPDAANEGIQGDAFTTVTGSNYYVGLWVYPDDATTVTVTVRNGADSADIFDQSFTGLTQDAWNKIVISYAETAGGAGAYIKIDSGALDAGDWYVDDVSITSFQGGREMTSELKSIEWEFANNIEPEFVPGAGGTYASRALREGREQTIKLDREFREYILQHHIDDNDELGLYIMAKGSVADSPHYYQAEIIFPAVSIIAAPISVDGKRLAEAGDLRVLEDSTFGSVIVRIKNLQSSYAA
ncbi:MAG: hypothetical protein SV375_00130 [Thermodesulfobacteriota bacterium]|nr:hypothetical protein [Thermodesulfobacteriota bacterium]